MLKVKVMRRQRVKPYFFTHRKSVIHEAVAVVAAIFSGGMQPHHHLVPPTIFAQTLREACDVAFGQTLELLYHLPSLVYRVKALDPKHDLHLDFQRQHAAKWFVLRID